MLHGVISSDDPRGGDARALLERHLAFARSHSPPEDVHAMDVDGLVDPHVTFVGFRVDGRLLGVGALKELDREHAEIKSMHVAEDARVAGVGSAIVEHLVALARERGYHRLSLETGSMDAFAPARSLYRRAGFVPCGPFAAYVASPYSSFMTMVLDADPR